ncbi:hypothetical protein GIB67_015482 [Kingdonia uniflora]|uniref:Uncharacterized protein n=1 Tax=Kingdonia uniflora TaxID=39325 RepID=A0A7J7LA67_9MAGN|nr:hypothetical protein GIB67_015482 [Kingdonia uniflora]
MKEVYEGVVYMHQGKTYLVNALDLSGKVALCQEANLKYYTKTRDYTDIHGSNGIFDTIDLSLPNYSYESQVHPYSRELLTAALDLPISCYCAGGTGCPNCVQYQFSAPEKTTKHKREEEGNEKKDWKRKKAEPRTWQRDLQQKYEVNEEKKKGKTNANNKKTKVEEADVLLKKKVKGLEIDDLTYEQLVYVPLIQLKTLIPKIPKNGLGNRAPRKRQAKFPELD